MTTYIYQNKKEARKHICERLKIIKQELFYQLNKISHGNSLKLTYKLHLKNRINK